MGCQSSKVESAAEEFCKDNRWEFKIMTEDDLGIKYK